MTTITHTDTPLFCKDLEEHIKLTYTYTNAVPNLDSSKVLHTDEYITCDKASIIDETNSIKYCYKLIFIRNIEDIFCYRFSNRFDWYNFRYYIGCNHD